MPTQYINSSSNKKSPLKSFSVSRSSPLLKIVTSQAPVQPVKIRKWFASQFNWAAIQIQKIWRGYRTRLNLWSYDGILTVSRIIKIQKVWRGWMGRNLAATLYFKKLYLCSNRIKMTYLFYKARKIVRRKKAERAYFIATIIQAACRRFLVRKRYLEMVRRKREINAKFIQRNARKYLAKRRSAGIRERVEILMERLAEYSILHRAGSTSTSTTISSNDSKRQVKSIDIINMSLHNEWEILDAVLMNLLATDRPHIGLKLATALVTAYPLFVPGIQTLLCCLLYTWAGFGRAKLVREDILDEAVEAMDALNRLNLSSCFESYLDYPGLFPSISVLENSVIFSSSTSHEQPAASSPSSQPSYPNSPISHASSSLSLQDTSLHSLPEYLLLSDPVSMLPSILDEIQITYFSAAMHRFRRSPRVLGMLACWRVVRNTKGFRNPIQDNAVIVKPGGARKRSYLLSQKGNHLLVDAFQATLGLDRLCCQRRMEITEQLFESEQVVILSQKVHLKNSYPDCLHDSIFDQGGDNVNASSSTSPGVGLKSLKSSTSLKVIGEDEEDNVVRNDIILEEDEEEEEEEEEDSHYKNTQSSMCLTGNPLFDGEEEIDYSDVPPSRATYRWEQQAPPRLVFSLGASLGLNKASSSVSPSTPLPFYRKPNVRLSSSTSTDISANIIVYKAGEALLIRGSIKLATPAYSLGHNTTTPSTTTSKSHSYADDRPKYDSSGGIGKGTAASPPPASLTVHLRPLIVLPGEITSLLELALKVLGRKSGLPEGVLRKRGKWVNLAEYVFQDIRVASGKSSGRFPFLSSSLQYEDTTTLQSLLDGRCQIAARSYHLELPQLRYERAERRDLAEEEASARYIQRAFRGFQGRALFRRLCIRMSERQRQRKRTCQDKEALAVVRAERFLLASRIQAFVRGCLWRKRLANMTSAAIHIQSAARVMIAKLFVIAEKRRRLLGPEVIEMSRNGVCLNGTLLTLVVKRCGYNYLLEGLDLIHNMRYEGMVVREEVEAIVMNYNKIVKESAPPSPPTTSTNSLTSSSSATHSSSSSVSLKTVGSIPSYSTLSLSASVQPLQIWHHNRVAELLVSLIAVTATITATTSELGAGKKDSQLCLITLPTARGSGIEHINCLRRVLADQQHVVDRYNKIMRNRQLKEKGEFVGGQTAVSRFYKLKSK